MSVQNTKVIICLLYLLIIGDSAACNTDVPGGP